MNSNTPFSIGSVSKFVQLLVETSHLKHWRFFLSFSVSDEHTNSVSLKSKTNVSFIGKGSVEWRQDSLVFKLISITWSVLAFVPSKPPNVANVVPNPDHYQNEIWFNEQFSLLMIEFLDRLWFFCINLSMTTYLTKKWFLYGYHKYHFPSGPRCEILFFLLWFPQNAKKMY